MRINGTNPSLQDLAGPRKLGNNHDRHGHGSGGVLIESQRSGAPIHESPH
jgi:hypothetical protein